jgi:ABC-type molybdate transport system permease subunit
MYSKISLLITVLLAAAILASTLLTAQQQQQQLPQTSQGLPIVIIPAITGNILTVVSFLIGTSYKGYLKLMFGFINCSALFSLV